MDSMDSMERNEVERAVHDLDGVLQHRTPAVQLMAIAERLASMAQDESLHAVHADEPLSPDEAARRYGEGFLASAQVMSSVYCNACWILWIAGAMAVFEWASNEKRQVMEEDLPRQLIEQAFDGGEQDG